MVAGDVPLSAELKALAEEYKVKAAEGQSLVQKLLSLVAEKEKAYEDLKFDLDDQIESRRQWQKRALEAESRFSGVQQIMVLVDGNQHFFRSSLVRAGMHGAKEAVRSFITEVKEHARQQHKNDLPENVSVVAHIFSDIGRLAHDLSAAKLLPEPDKLWNFIQEVCKLEPGFTISDCGTGHQAVDSKMKYFYELHIVNCHCRHLFLALGRESDYYRILQQYSQDEYTKFKTSLTRPSQGFPSNVDSFFHAVEFSTLESVPRGNSSSDPVSASANGTGVYDRQSQGVYDRWTQVPTIVAEASSMKPGRSPAATVRSVNTNILSPVANAETGRQSQKSKNPPVPESEIPREEVVEPNGIKEGPDDSSSAGVLKLESSTHSSSQSNKAAAQSWESETGNSYVPAPIEGAWGEEEEQQETATENSGGNQSLQKGAWDYVPVESFPAYPRRQPNGTPNRRQKPSWKQERSSNIIWQPPSRVPKQFEGSWDDMIQQEESGMPTQVSSPLPKQASLPLSTPTSGSDEYSAAFTRKVVVTLPEPEPNARPVRSPIALNKLDQRLDLVLPRPAPGDQKLFKERTANRGLCNEHHLRSNCNNRSCTYDHEDISVGVYLALRNKARSIACSLGPDCRKHDCFCAHHCPNVTASSACGRINCPFKARGMHGVTDLEIARTIEPPAKREE